MANETIRRLCDGEELVLAQETGPSGLAPTRDIDPRAAALERRHQALAGRSSDPHRPVRCSGTASTSSSA
jgi:hypothetical protein